MLSHWTGQVLNDQYSQPQININILYWSFRYIRSLITDGVRSMTLFTYTREG